MTTDPIADMLTRIRNALLAKHARVQVPISKIKVAIAKVLKSEGFIADYREFSSKKGVHNGMLEIKLKYDEASRGIIREMKRASKPGSRKYVKSKEIKSFYNGHGIWIVSTSQGLMTDREARRNGCGGELICSVW